MNPDLEDFLEEAFASMQPTSDAIGRVVVEPNYESQDVEEDSEPLRGELMELLNGQSNPQDGSEVDIPSRYHLLCKYVRRITLHANSVEGDWIEVAPPGNWI